MKIAKKEISSLCAILIIIMLTISDILLIGKEAVSYALDMAKIADNISFVSYFMDEKGNKVEKLERNISDEEYLYVDIMVENEGYFNGSIYIEDNNFNLSQEIVSPGIERIEGNRVYLNQIGAGTAATIKLKIEAIQDDVVALNLLNGKTKVSLKGEYVNSRVIEKGKNVEIDSYTLVEMHWNSDEEIWANLDANVITNSNITLNGEKKKLVQVEIKSNLEKNNFPLKSSKFELEIGELIPEKVTVYAKDLSGTNAALNLKEEKYSYNEDAGIYEIGVDNLDENTISWKKGASDTIIVSFILEEKTNIQNHEIKVSSKLLTYDDKELTAEKSCILDKQLDGTVEGTILDDEAEIYKGNLYVGEAREYQTKTEVDINFADMLQELEITENRATFSTERRDIEAEIIYKNIIFNKNELIDILGQDGEISIINIEGKEILKSGINELEADEEGNVKIDLKEGEKDLKITLSRPQKQGKITFKYTKQINNTIYNRGQISQVTGIKQTSQIKSKYEDIDNEINVQDEIKLIETTTQAELKVNQESIESGEGSKKVTIMATLKQNEESQDVYSNPSLKIELPAEVTKITSAKCRLIHAENFELTNAKLLEEDGKQKLQVELAGEQKNYYKDGIDGLDVVIYANLEVAEVTEPKQEAIKLYYENANRPGTTFETEEALMIMPKVETEIPGAEENTRTEQTDSFKVDIYETRGEEVLAQTDPIYEGETIRYHIKVTNITEGTINNIQVVGKTENAAYYDLVPCEVTFANGDPDKNNIKIFHEYNETDWEEKKFDKIESLEAGKSVDLIYDVVAKKKQEDYKLKSTISIYKDVEGEELGQAEQTLQFGENPIQDELAKINIKYHYYEEETINALEGTIMDVNIENTSGRDLQNVVVNLKWSDGLSMDKDHLDLKVYNAKAFDKETDETEIIGSYEILETKDNEITFKLNKLDKTDKVFVLMYFQTDTFDRELTEKGITLVANMTVEEEKYSSNVIEEILHQKLAKLDIKQTCNIPEDVVLKDKDNIMYTFTITNTGLFSASVSLEDILVQGLTLNSAKYTKKGETKELEELERESREEEEQRIANQEATDNQDVNEEVNQGPISGGSKEGSKVNVYFAIEPGETITVEANATVDQEAVENEQVSNYADLTFSCDNSDTIQDGTDPAAIYETFKTNIITHKVEAREQENSDDDSDESNWTLPPNNPGGDNDNDGNGDGDNNNGNGSQQNSTEKYNISGICYFDKNKNGSLEDTEKMAAGIKVQLLNTKTGTLVKDAFGSNLTATTSENGEYEFYEIEKGDYIVIFEYDTGIYEPTQYEAEGVDEDRNSNAIEKTINVDGLTGTRAITDAISLTQDRGNINLGLVEKAIYDLSLSKTVSKLTAVTSQGKEVKEFDGADLGKIEINAKYLAGSTVIIEYKINVTNEGEVAGYAKSIVDYKPADLNFDSSLNKDWYQSGDNLYTTSLANTIIAPGETKSVTLVLTKTMTETNTGLVNNQAEIAEDTNSLGLSDRDSISGNKQKSEDDMGSANVIINVKTGAAISYVTFTISIIGFLMAIAYLIGKEIVKKRIKL